MKSDELTITRFLASYREATANLGASETTPLTPSSIMGWIGGDHFLNVSFDETQFKMPNLLTGIFILLLLLMSCQGNGSEGSPSALNTSTSRKIFVVDREANSVSVFDLDEILATEPDENGDVDVAPVRSIGSVTGLARPQGIFVDTLNNEIFVANAGSNSINVYNNDRTKEGNIDIPPKRKIKGDMTNLSSPASVFVDTVNDEIYVTNSSFDGGIITVYKNDRTETGEVNISPERTISGETTGLLIPLGIFVDAEHNEIFVADFNNEERVGNILVFERTADIEDGEVFAKRVITIQDTTDEGFPFVPTSTYVDGENDELFVATFGVEIAEFGIPFPVQESENLGSAIKVYGRTDGDTHTRIPPSPLRTIRGQSTGLLNPLGIFVDTQANEIFAVNFFNNTVTVYENDRLQTGDLDDSPSRTLLIRDTNNSGFRGDRFNSAGIFVDTENDEIFVANQNDTVTVYGIADEGNVDPHRDLGSNTGLFTPQWIHVDTANGEIFVSNARSQLITVYGITDEGNVPPLRTISPGSTTPTGISVDADNDELFVAGSPPDSVRTHQATAGSPLEVIFGSNTGLGLPQGLYLDKENKEIFVANLFVFDSPFPSTITVYNSEGSGNTPPKRTIIGPDTELSGPNGVFVDTEFDEIFVANLFSDAITVYENDPTGGDQNISPKRTIIGPRTRLLGLQGVFVDTQHNLIFATNASDNENTVTTYENDRTSTGNLDKPPVITISGQKTGLSAPVGIFVTESP